MGQNKLKLMRLNPTSEEEPVVVHRALYWDLSCLFSMVLIFGQCL